MTDAHFPPSTPGYDPGAGAGAPAAAASEANRPLYGVGPFTVREVAIAVVWLVAFVVSFFPLYPGGSATSVWSTGIDWVLQMGVPTTAVFLLLLRRLSPAGIPRVGSLGIDQFASVAFSVATVVWWALLWRALGASLATGASYVSWVVWVEAILCVGLVVLTVAAPWIPVLSDDFRERPEVPAHRSARPARPVLARPRPDVTPTPPYAQTSYAQTPWVQPSAAGQGGAFAPAGTSNETAAYGAPYVPPAAPQQQAVSDAPVAGAEGAMDARTTDAVDFGSTDAYRRGDAASSWGRLAEGETSFPGGIASADAPQAGADADDSEPVTARRSSFAAGDESEVDETVLSVRSEAAAGALADQPFWALVPVERAVVDEATGETLFTVGPTAWALVLTDRGDHFVVRHEDGRTGILTDVSGVTRG